MPVARRYPDRWRPCSPNETTDREERELYIVVTPHIVHRIGTKPTVIPPNAPLYAPTVSTSTLLEPTLSPPPRSVRALMAVVSNKILQVLHELSERLRRVAPLRRKRTLRSLMALLVWLKTNRQSGPGE